MQDEKPHHVHFEASDELTHDNNIVVKQIGVGKIDIHVGFLQVMHKYEVIVSIPTVFLPNSENIQPEESTNLFARYQVRSHSTTTWTEFFDPPPCVDSFYTLSEDKNRHVLTLPPLILSM